MDALTTLWIAVVANAVFATLLLWGGVLDLVADRRDRRAVRGRLYA